MPASQEPAIEYHAPHPLPSQHIALAAITEYFREFHICHPFLDKNEVYNVFGRVYDHVDHYRGPVASLSPSQKQHLYKLNMVLAIGNIRLFRDQVTELHPFGFFTAALEGSPPSECAFSTINDVENLLLISLFGVYYNIGTTGLFQPTSVLR